MKISGDGQFFAVKGGGVHANTIKLLSKKNMSWVANLPASTNISSFSFSHDSKYLHAAGYDGTSMRNNALIF